MILFISCMNDRQLKCLFCMPCKGLHTEIYRLVSGMHHSTLPKLRKTQFHQNFDIRKLAMIYQSFVKSEGKFSGYDVCFFYSLYFQEGIIYIFMKVVRSQLKIRKHISIEACVQIKHVVFVVVVGFFLFFLGWVSVSSETESRLRCLHNNQCDMVIMLKT